MSRDWLVHYRCTDQCGVWFHDGGVNHTQAYAKWETAIERLEYWYWVGLFQTKPRIEKRR